MIRKLIVAVLLLTLLVVLAAQELGRRWQQALPVPADGFRMTVAAGESLRSVVNRLHAQGVLPYPHLVVIYARWTAIDQQIKRGEYLVPPGSTAQSLLDLLRSGKVIQYQVTLPEGITVQQALAILARTAELDHVLVGPSDPRVQELVAPYDHPEGLFFPDSYQFERGATDLQLLRRAHARMTAILEAEWQGRAQGLPFETPYEALILASIIERETGLAEERQQIAGVFVRRLAKGMRLQTDPTVIYGIGAAFSGNLQRKHLADGSNPYNTYRLAGLPPTPIALPGRAAIHAALHPDDGDTLYFVARGDGGHVFSETLAEHRIAVRQYQLQRAENYRSSPGKPQ